MIKDFLNRTEPENMIDWHDKNLKFLHKKYKLKGEMRDWERNNFNIFKRQFSKPGSSNMWTVNSQVLKLVLEKAEEPETKLPTSAGSSKKQESSRKTSISALLTMPKPLIVWITIKYGKFWKRLEYQTTWPASWETCMQVRKQQLELDMEQQTGSK